MIIDNNEKRVFLATAFSLGVGGIGFRFRFGGLSNLGRLVERGDSKSHSLLIGVGLRFERVEKSVLRVQ